MVRDACRIARQCRRGDRQPTNVRDDREQINKAREAAEALFAPKKQTASTEVPTSAPDAYVQIEQAHREPRIFAMAVAENFAEEAVQQKSRPKRGTSSRRVKVPVAQDDRVRTLVMYGMTCAEVADLYGVPLNVIERIVGKGPMTARR